MVEEEIRQGFGPLLAVLSSNGAERISAKNNLTFAELLLPFSTVEASVKDPSGTTVSTRLCYDIRDIRHEGFLLTLTVLPSVLHESVHTVSTTSDATTVFREALLRWAEPHEHEFLRTYIACLFVVSTEDADPLAELSQLIQVQHSQQHGASASAIGPAYCIHPKWMFSNTYKYHILVHDIKDGDEARAVEIFKSMTSVYGAENCYLLRINSGVKGDLTDIWQIELEKKNRGLDSGLALARKNVLSKAGSMGMGDSGFSDQQINLGNNIQKCICLRSRTHGNRLNEDDRKALSTMMKDFNENSLIPFVERQLRTMNEQITARRGISRSLTSGVRKLFGAATIQSNSSATVSYSLESSEMQTRRLADLSFLFGLCGYAYQLYQGLKKTFAVDQAWLHHAGALEMAAITFFLTNPQMQPKQYLQHYMENALNYYTSTCMRPLLAMRAALISSTILNALKLHTEAAGQLLKLTSLDNDLFAGILLERSSFAFGKAKMLRKMAFHYVLAGHRFFKAEQDDLALACYKTALAEYDHKHWLFAEDHILYILARDDKNSSAALECSKKLFRPVSVQNEEQQEQFFSRFLELLVQTRKSKKIPMELPSSLITAKIVYVIYGDNPEQAFPELVRETFDEEGVLPRWEDLEKSCFRYFFGTSRKFSSSPFVTDAFADYSNTYLIPINERLRIKVALSNFLGLSLTLKRVCLLVDDCSDIEKSFIEEVVLEPHCKWAEMEFNILPRKQMENIRVKGLSFGIKHAENTLDCQVLFKLEQRKSPNEFEPVQAKSQWCSVCAKVLPLPHPLFRIGLSPIRHLSGFLGQIYFMDFDVSNLGAVDIHGLCVATSRYSVVSMYEPLNTGDKYSWTPSEFQVCSTDRNILIFKPNVGILSVGTKKRLRIALRLPVEEVKSYPLPVLFYCTTENGFYRQERHLIFFDTHVLLSTSFCAVGSTGDLCLLRTRNLITSRDSLLAKVQLLGIRKIRSHSEQLETALPLKEDIVLKPLNSRPVLLECEQSDNFCFTIEMSQCSKDQSVTWFLNSFEEFPIWPVVSDLSNSQSSTSCCSHATLVNSQSHEYGILWKANIVNTDGTISNVIGENLVNFEYQFSSVENSNASSLASAYATSVAATQTVETSSEGVSVFLGCSLFCSVKCSSSVVIHDFSMERFCNFPVDIVVTNNDKMQRECELVLLCTAPGESYLLEKDGSSRNDSRRPFSSTVSLAPSVASMHFLPSTTQPLIIASCVRRHASVSSGSTHIFRLFFSVAAPSVYNVTCFELTANFQGSEHPFKVALPFTFVTVADKRAKIRW